MNLNRKYHSQKTTAKCRGIDWQFTYDTWIEWWGNDIINRGKGPGKLCMARKGDTGPYHPDNVYKITHSENVTDAHLGKPKPTLLGK